ncbi:Non-specific serine/threonine protein kinase [Mycena sanguinolenta]|uniref:non-specific serine/threonine protein kinase n=1 Tax=Mycena sanguinolenta TaxID=230812 RepID=A0A8H6ZBS6_9AGAR|nr:Non-specific serine/threonine protein kinase [Mycena sanguinolenta]
MKTMRFQSWIPPPTHHGQEQHHQSQMQHHERFFRLPEVEVPHQTLGAQNAATISNTRVAGGTLHSSVPPHRIREDTAVSSQKLGSSKSRSKTETKDTEAGNQFRNGILTICIFSGRGLSLPSDVPVPEAIQKALNNRESMQRKRYLPYVLLEFDKNEILIDAMEGDLSSPVWNYRAHFDVSRTSNVSVFAYLRTDAAVQGQDDMGNDLLMARVDLKPDLEAQHVADQWYAATNGTGSFHLQIDFLPTRDETPLTIEAFDLLQVIGKGSFGKVMQVRKKDTQRIYALKSIRKAHIAQRPGEITHILTERTVLALVNNPFIVPLKFSFQNPDKLYLVMPFINGGELLYHLQREGKFNEDRSRLYAAELLCAFEHIHSFDVVYRDLKPENILLDYTGHIALCDFGLCKLNMSETEKTNTFCGTPEYIAPELLESQGCTKAVDWWTLGVLLYEMMTGLPPFYDENINTMYQRILTDPLDFPPDLSSQARSVMTGLLQRDPLKRLGTHGSEEIKKHPFFARFIDWKRLLAKEYSTPFKPRVESVLDTANLDPDLMNKPVVDSGFSEGFAYNSTN